MDDNNTIEMLRLNPNQDPGDKTLKQNYYRQWKQI